MNGTLSELNRDYPSERERACGERLESRSAVSRSTVSHRLVQRVGGKRAEREVVRQCGGCLIFLALCPIWFAACVLAWPGVLAAAGAVAAWFGRW